MKLFILLSSIEAAANPKILSLINDYAGVQGNLKKHITSGDETIKSAISTYTEVTGRSLLEKKTTAADLKAKLANGNALNLSTMLAAAIPRDERSILDEGVGDSKKWLDYGCYCSPHQRHYADNWAGFGKPVDEIDALCQKLWNCHRCLEKTIDNCISNKSYKWDMKNNDIVCGNPQGSCRGELCRCEAEFVTEVSKIKKTWTKKYHIKHGFNRNKECIRRGAGAPPGTERKCCGKRLGFQLYNEENKECCTDGTTATIGTCAMRND